MTYIVKPPRTRSMLYLSESLFVRLADVHRTRRMVSTPFGAMREMEKVGENEQVLMIADSEATSPAGTRAYPQLRIHVERRQAALAKVVRRLREDDEASLRGVDEEIEAAKQMVRDLRTKRAQIVAGAWRRAREVPLREVVERIPPKSAT